MDLFVDLERFLFCLRARDMSPHTIRAYRYTCTNFLEFAARSHQGELTWAQIDLQVIRGWLRTLAIRKNSATSRCARLAGLRSFMDFLVRDGKLEHNWAQDALKPRRPAPLPTFLTEAEVTLIIEVADVHTSKSIRDRAILELLYSSGLRVSELCGLKLEDLELRDRIATIRGKCKRERIVPIGKPAVEALKRWLRRRRRIAQVKEQTVFVNMRDGTRLSARSVGRLVDNYGRLAKLLKHVHPHVFRHTLATHLLNAGADLRVIQELLGHENLASTARYTHLSLSALKGTYDRSHPRA